MNKFTKNLLTLFILLSILMEAWADKGFGRKDKNRATLNITVPYGMKSSIPFNLKSGLSYKGILLNTRINLGGTMLNTSIVTYQKGNSTYIIPYKNKITVTEVKQGYTGMKVIIRKK